MAYPFALPENFIVYQAMEPTIGAGADLNGRAVSLKNVHKAYLIAHINPVAGAGVAIHPETDSTVAFGSGAVLTSPVHIWSNEDTDSGDAWTRETDAVNFTTAANDEPKMVIFEIDPAKLPEGEDCVRLVVDSLANTDYAAIEYILIPRYGGTSQPSVLVD